MSFVVSIRQHPDPIVVEPGGTVLESALAQGVPYPHGCRSGNCGACRSRLESGEVEPSPYSPYALSDAERAQGLILACRAVPWSDAAVSWLEVDDVIVHPQRRLVCRVAGVAPLTHDITRVRLAIESGGPFSFSAGQYASLRFAALPPRDYSMANRRGERAVDLGAHFRALAAGHDNPRYRAVLSQPRGGTARRVGLVHEVVAADLADLDGAKAYLAGPPPMVEAATALLVDRRGMRRQDVHADAFYTEAEKAALNAPMPEAAAVAR